MYEAGASIAPPLPTRCQLPLRETNWHHDADFPYLKILEDRARVALDFQQSPLQHRTPIRWSRLRGHETGVREQKKRLGRKKTKTKRTRAKPKPCAIFSLPNFMRRVREPTAAWRKNRQANNHKLENKTVLALHKILRVLNKLYPHEHSAKLERISRTHPAPSFLIIRSNDQTILVAVSGGRSMVRHGGRRVLVYVSSRGHEEGTRTRGHEASRDEPGAASRSVALAALRRTAASARGWPPGQGAEHTSAF